MPWPVFFPSHRPFRLPWPCAAALAAVVAVAAPALTLVWRAVVDFKPLRDPAFASPYAETKDPDASLHGLAVNPRQHRDRFAAAELVFAGPAGVYRLELLAVAEEDGESVYRLAINGALLAARTNPPGAAKRTPVVHHWSGVKLRPGDRIAVHFAGHSNGRIPEGDSFAWSRGRWRSLSAIREPAD